jgi:hypothetical protein
VLDHQSARNVALNFVSHFAQKHKRASQIKCRHEMRDVSQVAVLRYHGAFTPSTWLTSYQLAGDNYLDRSEIGDGYGGKSRRVGAGQQAG